MTLWYTWHHSRLHNPSHVAITLVSMGDGGINQSPALPPRREAGRASPRWGWVLERHRISVSSLSIHTTTRTKANP